MSSAYLTKLNAEQAALSSMAVARTMNVGRFSNRTANRGRLSAIYVPSRHTNAVAKAVKTSFQPICYLGEGRPGAFLIKLTTGRSAHT